MFGEPYRSSNISISFFGKLFGTYKMTGSNFSCPGSLLKTTSPPPGYPWVSGGREVTPEPRSKGLVFDHQVLKGPEP